MARSRCTGLLLCLLSPFLAAQSDDPCREAAVEFARYFKSFKETTQKVEAVRTLEGMDCREAADELAKLLTHDDQEVRAAAVDVLSSYRSPATFRPVLDGLADANPRKRAVLIEVLGKARVADAVPLLTQIATTEKRLDTEVRYQIARALGSIGVAGDPAVATVLGTLLTDRDPLVRLSACDAIGVLRVEDLAGGVIAALQDEAWQVQSAAAAALGRMRVATAIEPLIALMKEGGRLREDAAEALFEITALDFGPDPEMWEKQWANLKSVNWRIPTEAELEKAAAARQRTQGLYGSAKHEATFAGIATTSTRVLFIIDVSASMEDMVVERERFDAGYPDFSKLTIVRTELMRTIDGLGPDTWFNVVAFASDVRPWKKSLVAANLVNKASAKDWVERLEPIGGEKSLALAASGLTGAAGLEEGKTNTHKALMHAFGIDPDKKGPSSAAQDKASIANKVDTVFFLSDGRPSTGKLVDTEEILKAVKENNQAFKIVFHAIAIGDFQKEFLRNLARDNGGVFVDLGR
jgi:hypothetical protein